MKALMWHFIGNLWTESAWGHRTDRQTILTPLNVANSVVQIAHFHCVATPLCADRSQTLLFQKNLREAPSNIVILKLPCRWYCGLSMQLGGGIEGRTVHLEWDGGGGKCVLCEQACKGSSNRNSVQQMIMWLASGRTVMLRAAYCDRLVLHGCSETNCPDQSSVVVFT